MVVAQGFKQTEVGLIPEDWQVKRLGQLATVVRGGSPRPSGDPRYFNGDFIPWLTVGSLTNISSSQLFVTSTATRLTKEGASRSRRLQPGTLVIVNSGAKTLGVSKVLSIECCANDGIAALIDQRDGDKQYICHFLNSQIQRLRDVVAAGNDQLNLNTSRIASIAIPYPDEQEQYLIAAALGDADALIESLEQLIAKQRAVKQGAMQELLRPKGDWTQVKLGTLGAFLKGSGVRKDDAQSGSIPCVRYGEIYTRHDDYIKSFYSFISPKVAVTAKRLRCGDVLFAGSGETKEEIGKCVAFISNVEAYAGGDTVILRVEKANSLFLGYYLNTPTINRQKASKGQGDAVVHISSAALADIEVILPPPEEQTAIAAVLSDMDAEIEALEAKLAKARQVKQGMMQELLTGRTRLV